MQTNPKSMLKSSESYEGRLTEPHELARKQDSFPKARNSEEVKSQQKPEGENVLAKLKPRKECSR